MKTEAVPTPISGREHVLQEASSCVLHARNQAYGNPEDNFKHIADVWNWWLSIRRSSDFKLTPQDVAYMMILMKVARLKTNPTHLDSVVDIAGYAACAGDFIFP